VCFLVFLKKVQRVKGTKALRHRGTEALSIITTAKKL
jgi:hypothetical protein